MRDFERVRSDRDLNVRYRQFNDVPVVRVLRSVIGAVTWPVILPLAAISRTSDFIFRTVSEMLAVVPYIFGIVLRYEFLRWALTRCGRNVTVGFGTVFYYRDVSIGDNVAIGNFNSIHHCDFGSYVLIADGCQFLSGSRYHNIDRTDIPMASQGGRLRRIIVSDDTWVGAGAIVMADIGKGAVIGAGAVVTKPVEPYVVAAGNPARPVRKRT